MPRIPRSRGRVIPALPWPALIGKPLSGTE